MAKFPLISVIIPVYNGESYIRRCLESLLAQDIEDMELIVVDDGSRDGTWTVIESMAREDKRIHPIRQQNQGVSAARNAGLDICRGRYIRFADADDVAADGSCAAMIECMEQTGASLLVAGYTEVSGSSRNYRSLAPQEHAVLEQEAFLQVFSRLSNSFYYGVLWNKLFLGDVVRQHSLRFEKDMKWGEDFHFVTSYLAATQAERIAYLNQSVYDYHRRMDGAVMRQLFDCVRHPFVSLKTRWKMYSNYRSMYIRTGAYPRYRSRLWLFLIRFTLHN